MTKPLEIEREIRPQSEWYVIRFKDILLVEEGRRSPVIVTFNDDRKIKMTFLNFGRVIFDDGLVQVETTYRRYAKNKIKLKVKCPTCASLVWTLKVAPDSLDIGCQKCKVSGFEPTTYKGKTKKLREIATRKCIESGGYMNKAGVCQWPQEPTDPIKSRAKVECLLAEQQINNMIIDKFLPYYLRHIDIGTLPDPKRNRSTIPTEDA